MGAYPALDVRVPQPQQNQLEQYANLLQVRNALQERPLRQQLLQQQVQTGQLNQQQAQLGLQQQQQAMQDQEAIRNGLADPALHGKSLSEVADKLAETRSISPQMYQQLKKSDMEYRQSLGAMTKTDLENQKAAHAATQELYNNIMNLPDDQLAAQWPSIAQQYDQIPGNNKQPLDPSKPLTKQQLQQFGPLLSMQNGYLTEELEKKSKQTAAQKAEAELNKEKAQAAWYAENGGAPGVPVEAIQQADWLKKNPGKGPSDFVAWKAKQAPLAQLSILNATGSGKAPEDVAKQFGMSPTAFDQTAEKYWTTGSLPPIGRGGGGQALNKALMNRAAELHPEGAIAANSAEYKANSESLKKLQSSYDTVTAFENTANKNINMLKNIAKKVPDLGTKFANVPVRMVTGNMIGTDNMSAFKTALLPVQTEAAKILNSANLSGQLSDSSRHELQEIVDGNVPYSALVASLNVLQQDFESRKSSTKDQIDEIQRRLSGKPAASPTGGFDWNAHPVAK